MEGAAQRSVVLRGSAQRTYCFLLASRTLECWEGLWVTFTAPHTLSDNYRGEARGETLPAVCHNANEAALCPTDLRCCPNTHAEEVTLCSMEWFRDYGLWSRQHANIWLLLFLIVHNDTKKHYFIAVSPKTKVIMVN